MKWKRWAEGDVRRPASRKHEDAAMPGCTDEETQRPNDFPQNAQVIHHWSGNQESLNAM